MGASSRLPRGPPPVPSARPTWTCPCVVLLLGLVWGPPPPSTRHAQHGLSTRSERFEIVFSHIMRLNIVVVCPGKGVAPCSSEFLRSSGFPLLLSAPRFARVDLEAFLLIRSCSRSSASCRRRRISSSRSRFTLASFLNFSCWRLRSASRAFAAFMLSFRWRSFCLFHWPAICAAKSSASLYEAAAAEARLRVSRSWTCLRAGGGVVPLRSF